MAEPGSREEAKGTLFEEHWQTPAHWPKDVRLVSMDALGRNLGIGPKDRLYWDGVPVVTKNTIRLEGWTFFLAFVATSATALAAIWPIALYFGWFGLKVSGTAS